MEKLLLTRGSKTHKGTYGRVGILGGSRGMTGSIYLSSKASLRSGAGLVYTIIPKSLETIMSIKLTEPIIRSIDDGGLGYFTRDSENHILEFIKDMDVLALGPGLGVDQARVDLVSNIVRNASKPLVIDADGLNCLSRNMEVLCDRKSDIIITPHLGEASRMLGISIEEIERDREYYARLLAEKYNVFTVLKSETTILASPKGDIYINNIGNPGMATAGSGDVLTGIIAGLLGQGLEIFDGVKLGIYIHSLAGDLAADDKGEYGMIASDILDNIPYAIKEYML